jgi:Zn-dependent M28 family amino/carboxypeptidase
MVEVQNGSIKRISVDQVGRQADGDSSAAAICDYGRQVAFQSEATNLVPDDTNGACEIFVAEEVGVHAVTLASGQTAAGLDFGNQI